VRTSEVDFHFPVLGFTPDREIWGFADRETLTSVGRRTLRDDRQRGMELIDAAGRRWIVRSIRKVGRDQPLIPWIVSALLAGPTFRIEQELEPLAPLSLDEVKVRVCESLEAFSQDYCADDEREEVLEPLLAHVRSAKSIAAIHEPLGLDSFMAY
jgi:hypothetical protein